MSKVDVIIKEGDIISISPQWEAYKIKSYIVLSVDDDRLHCEGWVKTEKIKTTYYKDELDQKTLEKYKFRNNPNSIF